MSTRPTKNETCDFCSVEAELPFRYAADDFELPEYNYRSVGEWRACATCQALIEHGKWNEIRTRSLAEFIRCQPDADTAKSSQFIDDLHSAFRSHRRDNRGA